jgi:periplasmic copper chaperone A
VKRIALLACFLGAVTGVASAAPPLTVSDAWSRPAIDTGVAYVRIRNAGASGDRLVGARSPVARAVELHRSMSGMGSMNGMAMNDVSSMEQVRAIPVPAHATVTLAPGGGHIMLIGLRHDLHAGETFPVQLHFARAGWVNATVHVRPI